MAPSIVRLAPKCATCSTHTHTRTAITQYPVLFVVYPVLTNHQKCRRQMRIGWTRQPRGAQCCAAQCTCHAPQSNNSDEGAQWWPSEPLTTATFAGTLRGRSAKEREEEERILLLVLGFCFGSCWKIICFSFGGKLCSRSRQVQAGVWNWPRTLAQTESSKSCSCTRTRGLVWQLFCFVARANWQKEKTQANPFSRGCREGGGG